PVANRYIPQGKYWLFRFTAEQDTLTCMVHAATALPYRCFTGNAPTILTLPKTNARIGLLYTYDVLAFGDPAPAYSLATAPAGMTIHAGTGRILWTPASDQEGMHDVTVVAKNRSGSDEQSFRINVAPASAAPEITSTPVTEAVAGRQYSYQVTADGTPPITYALEEKPDGMLIEPGRGTVFWTPSRAQAGTHPIVISASNNAGSSEQRFALEVYKVPRIDPVPDQLIGPSKPFWYQTSTDARPDATFTLNAGPAGLHIGESSGMITWTPTDQQLGSHTILFEARNRFGVDQRSFEIEVDATVGIDATSPTTEFRLLPHYPQPASASLAIPVQTGETTHLHLEVYDLLGRSVEQQRVIVDYGASVTLTIKTALLQPGLYFYRVQGGAQQKLRSFLVSH
ncbi:MAG: T9SS type A sorting domain-containing protein, partial [Bacteroidetes bacterium]|nr:T9SS type A sorting domain-containing protein [Bacteroidota bacterium]